MITKFWKYFFINLCISGTGILGFVTFLSPYPLIGIAIWATGASAYFAAERAKRRYYE